MIGKEAQFMNPEKRVALVTGGGQGIGKCVAQRLLKVGLAVVIAEIDVEAGKEAEESLKQFGSVIFYETDVGNEISVERAVRFSTEYLGQLDVLVNNAGISNPSNAPVHELSLQYWERVITTNLTGMFLCAKHCIPHLRRFKGAIVNIASTRAIQSEPNTEAYSASKGGVLSLTHALAMSLGPDIRVNCISPGWIDVSEWKKSKSANKASLTQQDHAQHPAGRVGNPEDIAALVAFLISEQAGFVTGQNFIVDGGMTKKMIYVQ
jgi:NAD(P)-dependent dehydrogenase (short-subunit alcohol dehydrogenase family)